MKALILAAGVGTRLEPLTLAVPKPMVPIVGRPVMEHNIELLRKYGFRDLIANLHYFPEQVEGYFKDGKDFGVNLDYSYEDVLLGTAGGVRRMAKIGRVLDAFLVLSSDALTDINLKKMVSFHLKKNALATVALKRVKDTRQFGVVVLDKNKRITGFQEKPTLRYAKSKLVNTGIYIFEPPILKMIPPHGFYDFGQELFPRMIKEAAPLFGYVMNEYWCDVGGLLQYKEANVDVLQKKVKLKITGKAKAKSAYIGSRVVIGKNVKFEGNVVIGDDVTVEDGSKIKGSIIWSDTYIGPRSVIDDTIIGSWCYLEGENSVKSSTVSNRCRLRAGVNLSSGTRLKPGKTV